MQKPDNKLIFSTHLLAFLAWEFYSTSREIVAAKNHKNDHFWDLQEWSAYTFYKILPFSTKPLH